MWNIDKEAGHIILLHPCVIFYTSTVPSCIHTHKPKGQTVSRTEEAFTQRHGCETQLLTDSLFLNYFKISNILEQDIPWILLENCKWCLHWTHCLIVSRALFLVHIHRKLHAVLSSESINFLCMHFKGCMAHAAPPLPGSRTAEEQTNFKSFKIIYNVRN